MSTQAPAVIYSIGQGLRTVEQLVASLDHYEIKYLCDVRSVPISNHKPEFCRDELSSYLKKAGLTYVFVGDQLGGKPRESSLLTEEGFVDYEALIASPSFQQGIERIVNAATQGKVVALFCSEADPQRCHRSKAIGRILFDRGFTVNHIDGANAVISQKDVFVGKQLAFFTNADEIAHSRKRMSH